MGRLSGRRICLIGGAGFVGHHLALRLRQLGAEVIVLDSLGVNNYHSLSACAESNPNAALYLKIIAERLELLREFGVPLIEADARDYDLLCRHLAEVDADAIVHLAAVSHAGRSNKDPYSTFDHSLRTLENALDNARSAKLRIRHFIYLSSSMVYGHFNGQTVTEDTPCEPLGIYGALKFAGEKLVIGYNQVFGMNYTIIRPSALYGERCVSRRVGQVFIENALRGDSIRVKGDGSDRLDFTYIGDLVEGIVAALTDDNAYNQVFNMTFGCGRSVAELVGLLQAHFGDLAVQYQPKDDLTPDRGTLSIEKARRLIGYAPQHDLERGFQRYLEWYEQFMGARTGAEVPA
ncbi:MAG: NAD(P)-dependent oxidoreductase [Planctomycetota bacterium]|nr:NAD(P)-dependent oxidoreductase [Planctomycetota bacterium]